LIQYSFHDLHKSNQEVAYHMWVLGFLEPLRSLSYSIKSNREAGEGRYDILLTPNKPSDEQYAVMLEFKAPPIKGREKEEDIMNALEQSANEALQQIKNKKYNVEAKDRGCEKILCLGIALYKKYISIKYTKEN